MFKDLVNIVKKGFPIFFGHETLCLIILACGTLSQKCVNTGFTKRNGFQFCTFLSKNYSKSHMKQQ